MYYPQMSLDGWSAGWNIATRGPTLPNLPPSSSTKMGVLDCGSTGIVGPKADVDAFYAALGTPFVDLKDGSYAFSCPSSLRLNASFVFGDGADERSFALRDSDLAIVRGTGPEFADEGEYEAMRGLEGEWCFGAISSWAST